MAGQTPEPSFRPGGQDSGLTQGRPAWQLPPPPSYTPPGGSSAGTGGGQAYAAPPPPYTPQDQNYPAQDQTQTNLGQEYQSYQAYQQQPGYQAFGAPQGQDQGAPPPPQWQGHGVPGVQHTGARPKLKSGKGLVGSLFDFSFTSMVTPKIIKALYILFTVWTSLAALGILVFFFDTGGIEGGLAALIIVDPIFVLLSLGVYRIALEAFMVIFQIHDELKTIRQQGENQA
jgi:Domain of unknown function (DUF4282)